MRSSGGPLLLNQRVLTIYSIYMQQVNSELCLCCRLSLSDFELRLRGLYVGSQNPAFVLPQQAVNRGLTGLFTADAGILGQLF